MEDLFMYAVYAAYNAVVLIPLGALMWFAIKRCKRVCQGRRWPQTVAIAVALGFLSVALLPFFKFGTGWVGESPIPP
jgi:predicted PurR-regulated permease PerM